METSKQESTANSVVEESVKDTEVKKAGSKILDEIVKKVKIQRDTIANWAQNWSVHTNHNNNSS
jgi:protein involved in sex pheromone biosynthesis